MCKVHAPCCKTNYESCCGSLEATCHGLRTENFTLCKQHVKACTKRVWGISESSFSYPANLLLRDTLRVRLPKMAPDRSICSPVSCSASPSAKDNAPIDSPTKILILSLRKRVPPLA